MRDLFLPIIRADFEMIETYEYQLREPLSCPVSVYGGLEDKDVPLEDLRAWKEDTSGMFELKMFSGDHFFIHSASSGFLKEFGRDVLLAARKYRQAL